MKIVSEIVAKHDVIWKKFHEEHVQSMLAELKATVLSLQQILAAKSMMLAFQPRIQLFFCLEPATDMFSENH